jgi:hypothetical protein
MTRRVKDGIGDCRCYTNKAGLSQAFRAERIDDQIVFFDEDHVDVVDVRINRHVIIRETVVHEASEPLVHQALLLQRHADAPDDSPHDLTARSFRIQDASACHRGDDARYLDRAQVFVDSDFRKYRRVRMSRVPRLLEQFGDY